MATTYSTKLRLAKPAAGELTDTWGPIITVGVFDLLDDAVAGIATVTHSDAASYTLTANNGAADEARCAVLKITGALTAARNVVCPTQPKSYIIENATTGGFAVTLKTAAGTGIAVANGASAMLRCDGTNVVAWVKTSNVASNFAMGPDTLAVNTSGARNAAFGASALGTNTTGADNTGCGNYAGWGISTGASNTAMGASALQGDGVTAITGASNTGVGHFALGSLTTGSSNVAVGYNTLIFNTAGTGSVAVGAEALRVNTANYNVAVGFQALKVNTTGTGHTAVGVQALVANTTGVRNTAFGNVALYANTIGSDNCAFGVSALQNNVDGLYNCAFGLSALHASSDGSNNSAFGHQALRNTSTGDANAACGALALYTNSTGSGNSAVGSEALYTATGDNNTAIGWRALQLCSTGHDNTALGYKALQALTTGSGNVGIGPQDSAGNHNPVFNITTENNRISMGSTATTNAYVQVAWTVVSDARDKTDFAPVPHGLEFVCRLRPTQYRYKANRDDTEGHGPLRYGFKAQDVLELEGRNPVIVDAEDPRKLRFNDQALLAVLVNAIKELREEVIALRDK